MTSTPKRMGKVYIVGAGPGDPALLTLKGKACLEQADVVLFDYLANPVLLEYAQIEAERIYVGRRGRGAYRSQDEINQLLVTKAGEGKCVVRLKGGDPFVFGRGGEEAEVVADAGIPYEVVPGITSAVAVPAYAGIPVTHRTLASTVTFVTGHEDPSKPESVIEWPRLATVDGTLVFLMGVKNLPTIVEKLLAEGKDPQTPVALIRWGTYLSQQSLTGTLADIVEKSNTVNVQPPTTIVIGRVVELRDRLNWFERRPLFGKRLLVTRPKHQAPQFSRLLEAFGAEAVECPTLEIVPPESWSPVDHAIANLSTYQWLILTSVNGVRAFMERLKHHGRDIRSLAGLRLCCIGPRTAEEAARYGILADVVPDEYQAEGVIDSMEKAGVVGQRILIPRAEVAREILPRRLREMGASVDLVTTYRAVLPTVQLETLKNRLASRSIHYLTFASSSTVRNFCGLFENQETLIRLVEGATIACIGPITAETARECGLSVGVVAKSNTIPALAEAIVEHAQQTNQVHDICSV
ncbi:MAG: uroporphyrinogen-III C-methyltransferase [Nitrospirales bacterium]|nr:uroporphyrinogen-III C-methyltransferase [Nitrospira sp.]MDR4500207.1 uroporphyrinogen-III C-methyltransferase [Nitrospirales bacterium]